MIFTAFLAALTMHFAAEATAIQAHICLSVPSTPSISQPANNTNSTQQEITASGVADANTTIVILDDNQPTATTTSDSIGNFAVAVKLHEQTNQLVAQVTNICNDATDSSPVAITYTPPVGSIPPVATVEPSTPPVQRPATTPVIAAPSQTVTAGKLVLHVEVQGKATTSQPSIFVNGSANMSSEITIFDNQQLIARFSIGAGESFHILVPLTIGSNHLVITATTPQSTATTQLSVTRVAVSHQTQCSFHIRNWMFIAGVVMMIIVVIVLYRHRCLERAKKLRGQG